jgi:hypothetical protein
LVAAEYSALNSSTKVVDLAAKEMDDYGYIYPVARVRDLNHGDIS